MSWYEANLQMLLIYKRWLKFSLSSISIPKSLTFHTAVLSFWSMFIIWLGWFIWLIWLVFIEDYSLEFPGFTIIFFSIWVFFHSHSRITGLQGKGEDISLTPHYHFHPFHKHLESSPLHMGSCRTRTGNLWFPSASRYH